ncbi:2,3-bisphosphoglycerate-independent phosphoglycerate mutase [Flavobacteriaceae bacterium]|nr:2,3-bisphosphoglycerate-independent phosphoglycerate mutase [Flavobacteriaceae bacterium]MDA9885837.1 2,3-bisphosphoglycerate-independent phosphoglycerate mutase [Flavobacteriaceae bacterium]MDA9985104.1 2,3-bisphosphoglycerate-independent phosphoglycerate mutase [Flavobacteriaceae bacterium]MDB2672507.1 2,3-bisphosphoglycerate-independent phosphoglycerate mutase [Flavobacteriaceae bacterium]MDB4186487.1 2,3-bisphosphoglycerate-independent phosphoglycerate mutase [Flavobacteriaceae bacterium
MSKKTILMILDGWGKAPNPEVSAVDQAKTPFIDSLYQNFSHNDLYTDGMHVGLPEGQMGNSEVGHMNLGAGRIVYQDLAKINLAIAENTLKDEVVLKDAMAYAKANDKTIHLLGLLSNGGVHSHVNHVKSLLNILSQNKCAKVALHGFTDGRDVDPHSGAGFVADLEAHMAKTTGKIGSLIGRYFAMDRDQRWDRVQKAYALLVNGEGAATSDFVAALETSYQNGVTDEFIEPLINNDGDTKIEEGDVVLFFNFRTDRGRELTQMLSQKAFPEQGTTPLDLHYVTLTNYDSNYKNVNVVFNKDNITDTLGETISNAGKIQIRIAETEKYPHVTFFFNGGREEPFKGEERILCPSPKVATYDLQPEMSAYEIRDAIIPEIQKETADFICLNFANPDMVGHTGDLNAAIKACETVDECAEAIVEAALAKDYSILVIADHGNCETMLNEDGSPNTAHTTNPVPVILVENEKRTIQSGVLGAIAPTILDLMGIPQPAAMTQKSLL